VSFIDAGTCTITASQPGSATYEAAPDAQQTFAVTRTPQLVSEPPGSTTGNPSTGGGSSASDTLSFHSATAPPKKPDNSFELVGRPRIASRTGAITFSVLIRDPGSLSWTLTFRNGSFGVLKITRGSCRRGHVAIKARCQADKLTFATGHVVARTPGVITFTASPRTLAGRALRAAAAKKRSLPLLASLSFQSALGGIPTSQTHPLVDHTRR
jgi:hypothetical protein